MNRYRTLLLRVLAFGIVLTTMTGLMIGQSSSDTLEQGFQQPPDSAKPRVWWHWMNGNISKEGIKLDLEWMHRVRIARIPELRCRSGHASGGGSPVGLHDTGLEGRFQIRDHLCRSTGNGNGDCGFAGLERDGRPMGSGVAGNEEVCVELRRSLKAASLSRERWLIRHRILEPFRTWAYAVRSHRRRALRRLRSTTLTLR